MLLKDFIKKYPRLAVAFSGGVDSSYLLAAAKRMGADLRAYFVKSEFQTAKELKLARATAQDLGVELTVLELSLLSSPVAANLPDRCYRCKKLIFAKIIEAAKKDNYSIIVDGSNASDDPALRPGMKVLEELNIFSPLRLAGLKEENIRALAKEEGFDFWDRLPNSCLATRIENNEMITAEKIAKIEKAESFLHQIGIFDLRIKSSANKAVIQIKEEDFPILLENKKQILEELQKLFNTVALDLLPRDWEDK